MSMKSPPLTENLVEIDTIDISNVLNTLNDNPQLWEECDYRQKNYNKHEHTKTILCVWSGKYGKNNPQLIKYDKTYNMFESFINEILNKLKAHFDWKKEMVIYKAMFAKLPAGKNIHPHVDGTRPLRKPHRIHIPILTEDHLIQTQIGGETYHLKAGTIYDFNNTKKHAVKNESTKDRINFIIDVTEVGTLPKLEKSKFSVVDLKDARVKIL